MVAVLLDSMNTHFDELTDPRRQNANLLHPFSELLTIAISAMICGADNWVAMETFARSKEKWLRSFLTLPNGIPSHDVFNNVFAKLEPLVFERCFIAWAESITSLMPGEVIAIDGKTVRRSHDRSNGRQAIHLVSAWAGENELLLGQVKTEDKSNEIKAIPELLELLTIEGTLVTIDAMGCQKAIAERILSRGADYLLAVKNNQPSLYEAIQDAFFEADDEVFHSQFAEDCVDVGERAHGRQETRRCWVCTDLDVINCDLSVWQGLVAIVVVASERTVNGETTEEYRFYITSRKDTAAYYLTASRRHWLVENQLHWVLDVAFDEDRSRTRKDYGAENLSVLRRIALNLLKREKTEKVGIANKRLRAGWDESYLLKVLSGLAS